MAQYIIYFNQQWVGDHPEEWYLARGPLARVDVDSDDEANKWGAKIAQACGWPQEIRKFKG